jgi:hypothetical protein
LTREKRAVEVAQVVKHLPTKCKALSSNPILPKNKGKRYVQKLIIIISLCEWEMTERTII